MNLLYPDLQESAVTQAETNTRATHIENKFLDKRDLNTGISPQKKFTFHYAKKRVWAKHLGYSKTTIYSGT